MNNILKSILSIKILVMFLITEKVFYALPIEQKNIILDGMTIYENGEYKNSGTISNSAEASNINLKGNGVENYSNLVLDFFNSGIISGIGKGGEDFGDYAGNGILGQDSNIAITNNGEIKGSFLVNSKSEEVELWGPSSAVTFTGSANGALLKKIYSSDSFGTISLSNHGTIKGKMHLTSANLVTITEDESKEVSNVTSSIVPKESGNGILSKGSILDNKGIISGNIHAKSGDVEVSFVHKYEDNHGMNLGVSDIYSVLSGNGLVQIEKVEKNNGIVLGMGEYKTGNVSIVHKNNYDPNKVISSRIKLENSNNGIYSPKIELNSNNGIISGTVVASAGKSYSESDREKGRRYSYAVDSSISLKGSGNGLYGEKIENKVTNNGILSGYTHVVAGEFEEKYKEYHKLGKDYILSFFSGNGIATPNEVKNITNSGIIKGSTSAIAAKSIEEVSNYGILAGREIFSNGKEIIKNDSTKQDYQIDFENGNIRELEAISPGVENNRGIYVKLEAEKSVEDNSKITGNVAVDALGNVKIEKIDIGTGGEITLEDGTVKTVINGTENGDKSGGATTITGNKDIYLSATNLDKYTNIIINGTGMNKGALVVDKDTFLSDSIVNGYNSAIYLEDNTSLSGDNIILNGGGLKGEIAVIKGSEGDNKIELVNNSVINGQVDLGNGDDRLFLDSSTQINGKLDGGAGNDILNLGENQIVKTDTNLNILHDISGFENINTNGNITLFETVKIAGAENINLESGNLTLRVDPTLKDAQGRITGHALYKNNGTLTSIGGNLVIGLNGLGVDSVVSMGGTSIDKNINDSWWKDSDHLTTNSLVLDAKFDENGDILVTIKESIPLEPSIPVAPDKPNLTLDSLYYKKLNKIYQSIVNSEEIGKLANTTLIENKTEEEALGNLLVILSQMYANNPYSYMIKGSKDSMKVFEDNMSYLTIKPKKDEYIAQGKMVYTGVRRDNILAGKNYYGFDIGENNHKTTTSIYGGIGTLEYGLSDKTSVGIVLGGNNQSVNYRGSSEIDADSLYLGTFIKSDIDNNIKLMGGIGYQYTSADATRSAVNNYDSFKTGDRYDINSLNAYIETKYSYEAKQNWRVEPKLRLSYYYVEQDKIDEGYDTQKITMKTDRYNSNTVDLELGVDFIKSINLEDGKLKNIISLGMTNVIGDKSKELSGNIIGKDKLGSKIDIQGVRFPDRTGEVSYNLEYEKTNGLIYTVGVNFEFGEDYNRMTTGTIGIGYKY
ncbi:MAG: autotransporter outer membrane beta-barrel domain-containing protein [Fusobacterium mortiferum]|nr:autotransporter outer membrane beta-barrel domain-containing protein [Fusobacterium mortiferum]MDY5981948.1 autotransporter outer membrane beta-barrel domain-containing protein [Fusobacterium mortiferum]